MPERKERKISDLFERLDEEIPISYARLREIIKREEEMLTFALESSDNSNDRDYYKGGFASLRGLKLSFKDAFDIDPNSLKSLTIRGTGNSSPYYDLERGVYPNSYINDSIDGSKIGIRWRNFLSAASAIATHHMRIIAPQDYLQTPPSTLMERLLREKPFFQGLVLTLDQILRELGYQVSFLPGPTEGTILLSPGMESPVGLIETGQWPLSLAEAETLPQLKSGD